VEITSHQTANIRFTLRGTGYDQIEVDEFRERVRRSLAAYESQFAQWRTNGGAQAPASDTGHEAQSRGGGDEAAAYLAAAKEEASRVLAAALAEGGDLLAAAKARAASIAADPRTETRDLTQRLARLRTAVSDAETRLRNLVGSTLDELSLVGDLIDLEMAAPAEISALRADSPWRRKPDPQPAAPLLPAAQRAEPPPGPDRDIAKPELEEADDLGPDVPGFYEKRLVGLRDRLDRNGS